MSDLSALLASFFATDHCSLKICGVTRDADALGLIDCGVTALGVNFWPLSKRFIAPDDAASWLRSSAGRILRVGVFVNAATGYMAEIYQDGLIDVVQMHGDESPDDMRLLADAGIPCIKALGIHDAGDLVSLADYASARALLLDTAAPGVYGGTGATFDWSLAVEARRLQPQMPLLLAGGITPDNARAAIAMVRPAAIDIASGAESSPGVKDFDKVRALLSCMTA